MRFCGLRLNASSMVTNSQWTSARLHTPPATGSVSNPLPVAGQRAGYLLDCIDACFNELGLAAASGDDPVLRVLVRARIIHPSSKLDFIETLAEVGITSASYRTIQRRRSSFATESFGEIQTQALAHHVGIGPGAFILYDVTILYFEADTPDELRNSLFSKERRVEPQNLVGLLTDATGFPLHVGRVCWQLGINPHDATDDHTVPRCRPARRGFRRC